MGYVTEALWVLKCLSWATVSSTSKERRHCLSPLFSPRSYKATHFRNNKEGLEVAGIFFCQSLHCDPWDQVRDILVPGSVGRFQKDLNFQPRVSASNSLRKFTLGHVPRKRHHPNCTDFSTCWMNSIVDFLISSSWLVDVLISNLLSMKTWRI